jgi:hypothetical protein
VLIISARLELIQSRLEIPEAFRRGKTAREMFAAAAGVGADAGFPLLPRYKIPTKTRKMMASAAAGHFHGAARI